MSINPTSTVKAASKASESNVQSCIVHFLPDNYVWGGIETYLANMLPILSKESPHRIVAIVTQGGRLYDTLKASGVEVYGIPFPFKKHSLVRSAWVNPWLRMFDLKIYWDLIPLLKKLSPDLVHLHCGRIEQRLIHLAGFPLVYTYHGYGGPYSIEASDSWIAKQFNTLARPLFQWLVPALSGMLVVSQYEYKRLYREKYLPKSFQAQVLHNGIPMQQLKAAAAQSSRSALRQSWSVDDNTRVIGYMCRLRADKNPLALLKIAKQVIRRADRKNPVFFLVAGDGKLADQIAKAFEPGGELYGYGRYVGFRNDIPALINACDITISTSLHEGFGLRVLESMLFGKPSIAYAVGGIPEVYGHTINTINGHDSQSQLTPFEPGKDWLIEKGDEAAFISCLTEVINWPNERFAALAAEMETHAHQFDLPNHIQQLNRFYEETVMRLGIDFTPSPGVSSLQVPKSLAPESQALKSQTAGPEEKSSPEPDLSSIS
ncbi:MAG: glycosyltransferase [Cyanobacteria bacterium P01_H01_bin.74]